MADRRIFTVVGRAGHVIITDSKKIPGTDNGTLYQYYNPEGNTQLEAIKALNGILSVIPKPGQARFDLPVVFLLPRFIEFLRYEDTRKVWISTGKKKNGQEIDEELLKEVKALDKLVTQLGSNIQLFSHRGLKKEQFIQYKNATWNLLNEKVPEIEKVDANEAF